ncbi:hypothetical protein [Luteibacter sp. 3190]|uniref:hypothetical protein n=1 Tax=Luteibacter sp. 3190 TaxID=2817736 RepID=UPI002864F7D9|nr:hypothetical protein [Luteibacter sp. 3190]MDR6935088.1 hypothetical protein [Luteibacter sp. 3190]
MANEKNRPPQTPGQDIPPEERKGPTEQRPTDASGDALDGSGEDNQRKKKEDS